MDSMTGENLDGLGAVPETIPDNAFHAPKTVHPLDRWRRKLPQTQLIFKAYQTSFYLHGSAVNEGKVVYHSRNAVANLSALENIFCKRAGRVDIVEIFGGNAGGTKLAL